MIDCSETKSTNWFICPVLLSSQYQFLACQNLILLPIPLKDFTAEFLSANSQAAISLFATIAHVFFH